MILVAIKLFAVVSCLLVFSVWALKDFDTKIAFQKTFLILVGLFFVGGYIFFLNRKFDFSKPLDFQSPGGGLGIEYSRDFFPLLMFIAMVLAGLLLVLFQWNKYQIDTSKKQYPKS